MIFSTYNLNCQTLFFLMTIRLFTNLLFIFLIIFLIFLFYKLPLFHQNHLQPKPFTPIPFLFKTIKQKTIYYKTIKPKTTYFKTIKPKTTYLTNPKPLSPLPNTLLHILLHTLIFHYTSLTHITQTPTHFQIQNSNYTLPSQPNFTQLYIFYPTLSNSTLSLQERNIPLEYLL